MFNIWPYLLRLAVAMYFIYPSALSLAQGVGKLQTSIFGCINDYIPAVVAFTLFQGFFIVLGILILIWPRPILPLLVALIVLSAQLYIHFASQSYNASNMLLFILVLVSLSLIIYHSRPQFR